MEVKKYRWSKTYESQEEELICLLATLEVTAERRVMEEYGEISSAVYEHQSRIWCAEGSIIFNVSGKDVSLQPGDTLEIPAYTAYEATAGFSGCVYYIDFASSKS